MTMVSGAPTVLAEGSSPVEVFALFANLCANVSVSLRGQAKAKQMSEAVLGIQKLKDTARALTLLYPD